MVTGDHGDIEVRINGDIEGVGRFELVPTYGDGETYVAKCLQPECAWTSQKTTRPSELMAVNGPVTQHHRDAHGYEA